MKYKPQVVNIALRREDAALLETILNGLSRDSYAMAYVMTSHKSRIKEITRRITSALSVNVFTYYND